MTERDSELFHLWVDWARVAYEKFVEYVPSKHELCVQGRDGDSIRLVVDPQGLNSAIGSLRSFGEDLGYPRDVAAWNGLAALIGLAADEVEHGAGSFSVATWTRPSFGLSPQAKDFRWILRRPQ